MWSQFYAAKSVKCFPNYHRAFCQTFTRFMVIKKHSVSDREFKVKKSFLTSVPPAVPSLLIEFAKCGRNPDVDQLVARQPADQRSVSSN